MKKMSKLAALSLISVLVLALAPMASATVGVTVGPTSLVPDPILVKGSSSAVPLFSFTIGQDAGETLSSVAVLVMQNGTTTVSGADLAKIEVFKDDGDGSFDAGDTVQGTQSTVNLSPTTTIVPTGGAPLASGVFFVTLSTSASWSGSAPADSIKVTFPADSITSSAGVVSNGSATTNSITADTTGPVLDGALAKNTGGTGNKEAGDSVELVFSEGTNKPTINSGNVNAILTLSSGHSWLSTDGTLGGASWNTDGKVLTITLGATTTAAVGDTVTVSGSTITDIAGNSALGNRPIVGTFGGKPADDDKDENRGHGRCGNDLKNGRLYKIRGEATVYLAAACRLKPFRGAAVFHARGHKFQNIIILDSLPSDVTISDKPVLPAGGALIQGSNATVWFVTHKGKRKGFTSAEVFRGLGFAFGQVKKISDEDLATIPEDTAVNNVVSHPEGALIKCGSSATVFEVIGNSKFPFQNAESFTGRGHSWDNIAVVDCGRFAYVVGAAVAD